VALDYPLTGPDISKVTVAPVPLGEFPQERGVSEIRDIRLKVTDGSATLFVEILPASNGWWSVRK